MHAPFILIEKITVVIILSIIRLPFRFHRLGRPFVKANWWAFDFCPAGYEGKKTTGKMYTVKARRVYLLVNVPIHRWGPYRSPWAFGLDLGYFKLGYRTD